MVRAHHSDTQERLKNPIAEIEKHSVDTLERSKFAEIEMLRTHCLDTLKIPIAEIERLVLMKAHCSDTRVPIAEIERLKTQCLDTRER